MTDIVQRLRNAIHYESAAISPQTTTLIEEAREATYEIERLRQQIETMTAYAKHERDLGAEEVAKKDAIVIQELKDQIETLENELIAWRNKQ